MRLITRGRVRQLGRAAGGREAPSVGAGAGDGERLLSEATDSGRSGGLVWTRSKSRDGRRLFSGDHAFVSVRFVVPSPQRAASHNDSLARFSPASPPCAVQTGSAAASGIRLSAVWAAR
ncbi:hypothetical protein GTR04_2019 [Trichophyton interdigitale]|uniref:Uncharacterized protein n=1 Tax=Trichophyton interdigitale TaxID=101480 RepID=A0A9P4YHN4_9EURO|nr:hypothetical protein GY632_2118 [Trichophyton interdigitale]KAG5210008.1 hypothetical protein GY631_5230 [Trichophyton interdigitale]KAG8210586.1 hypothetical protein GTR04_2019 [Trichophyton interdigitale]